MFGYKLIKLRHITVFKIIYIYYLKKLYNLLNKLRD